MNPENPYTPKLSLKQILIIAGILLVVMVVAFFVFNRAMNKKVVEKKNAYINSDFLPGIQSAFTSKSNPDQITIFNGRNFIEYNLATKQQTRLIPTDLNLPNISNIQWSKDGQSVSFLAKNYSQDDDLGKVLKSQNMSLGVEYFWIYSLSDKQVKLIKGEQGNVSAVFWSRQDENKMFYSIPEENEESSENQIIIYSLDTKSNTSKRLVELNGTLNKLIDTSQNNFIALVGNGTHYLVTPYNNGTKGETIATLETDTFDVSPDGKSFYSFAMNENTDGEEGTYDIPGVLKINRLSDGKTIHIIKEENLSHLYSWNNSGSGVYSFYYEKNKAFTKLYDLGKNEETILATPTNNETPSLISIIPTIKDWFFIFTTTSGLGLTSDSQIEKPYSGSLSAVKTQDFSKGFVIGVQNDNTVRINIYNNPIDVYKKSSLDFIKSKGVTPDLINYVFDTTPAEEKF